MTSGVNITGSSGQPGANASIRIRGMGSFNASNEPLFVIDGVPVTSGNLSTGSGSEASYMNNAKTNIMSTINPSDIENITVIKDAAAASPLRFPCGQRCYLDHDQTRIERTYPGHVER